MSHWLTEIWIKIQDISIVLALFFVSLKNHVLLVSWCEGDRCGMTCSDEDHDRSRRTGAEDREWSHRLGTRWLGDREVEWRCVGSAPCTWRRGARVSWLSLKTKVDSLWLVWPQNQLDGFSGSDLKTGSSSLVIWASKSPRWFLGLGLKTKQVLVSRLRHKIDGGRTTWDTRRDLEACFAWKQVTLGFLSLALRLAETWWRIVHVTPS
jgi:hypothetical protein